MNVLWGLLKKLREYREPASFGTATVATAADNRTAAVVTSKGKLIRFDLTTGAATPVTTGIDSAAAGPVFSLAGKLLAVPGQASFGQPAPVAVIDRATGKTQHTFRCPDGGPVCAAFSPDGRYLVTGTNQTTALGWELTR